MDTDRLSSFGELALEGVERIRKENIDVRGRVAALLLLLRGAYFTGEDKWRALAEEDLRALWRGGVHDHFGGGFFSASYDREWLRPRFEKRLDDNAVLAYLCAEAWERGRMSFYREAAESALDWTLRELATPSGLYGAGQRAAGTAPEENPYLFTPAQIAEVLGEEAGRHFAECYDVTAEGNCGAGSIPNLILNERWNLLPEGYDDFRERLRLEREKRPGLLTDLRCALDANALLLAALAKCGRVFSDRRCLAAAEALRAALVSSSERFDAAARAALCFALTELYAASFDPACLAEASAAAPAPEELFAAAAPSPAGDRALALAALGYDALLRLTRIEDWREKRGAVLRELCLHPERHGPESLSGLCALLAAGHEERTLLCASPEEERPAALRALTARYAPDLTVVLKTPARAAALAAAAPWTESVAIGSETLFYPCTDGRPGEAARL